VLTAPAACARSAALVRQRERLLLERHGQLSPLPPSATKAAGRPCEVVAAAEDPVVDDVLAGLAAKAAWMSGDLLCAIGFPMTA